MVALRLDAEVHRLIEQQAGPRETGKVSGVSAWIRQCIYEKLGLGEPPVGRGRTEEQRERDSLSRGEFPARAE